jgi:hypothetical protein
MTKYKVGHVLGFSTPIFYIVKHLLFGGVRVRIMYSVEPLYLDIPYDDAYDLSIYSEALCEPDVVHYYPNYFV